MNGKSFSASTIKVLGSECNLGTKYEKKNGYVNIPSVYYAKITI